MSEATSGLGRVLRAAGRVALWGAVAVVLARGVLDIVDDEDGAAAVETAATTVLDDSEAPADAAGAGAFAARFVADYLTFDSTDPARRREALAPYLAAGVSVDAGWTTEGAQRVDLVVPVSTTAAGDRAVTVVVAARVGGARWLHVVVPVHAGSSGFAVTALPALVPNPTADATVERPPVERDAARSLELRPTLEGFFHAYAGAGQAELDRYLAPGTRLPGLDGAFALAELVDVVAVGDPDGGATSVTATVRWLDPTTGAGFAAAYDLSLVERDGRWYVAGLQT